MPCRPFFKLRLRPRYDLFHPVPYPDGVRSGEQATPFPHCAGTKKPLFVPISHAYPPAQGPAAHLCSRALYGQIRFFRSVDADVRHGVDGRAPFMAATISSVTGTGRDLRPPRHGIIGKGIDRHGRTFFPHNHKIVRCVWQAANFSAKQQKRADRGIPADAPVFPRIGFNFPNGSAAYPRADTP